MNPDEQLREIALRLATALANSETPAKAVVERAQAYYEFLSMKGAQVPPTV